MKRKPHKRHHRSDGSNGGSSGVEKGHAATAYAHEAAAAQETGASTRVKGAPMRASDTFVSNGRKTDESLAVSNLTKTVVSLSLID